MFLRLILRDLPRLSVRNFQYFGTVAGTGCVTRDHGVTTNVCTYTVVYEEEKLNWS